MANFSRSSRNYELHGTVLHAECANPEGEFWKSTLNLDLYIANDCGKFQWEGKYFSTSASDLRLEGTVFYAVLYTPDGEGHEDSVDLDSRVANICGHLSCMNESLDRSLIRGESAILSDHNPPDLISHQARRERHVKEIAAMDARRALLHQAISDEPLYKHDALGNENNFRLLRITSPGDEQDVVECSVIEVDSATCPKFAALSYTWGSPFPPTAPSIDHAYQKNLRIRCNRRMLEVGQNLYDALRRLRGKILEKSQDCLATTALMVAAWNNVLVDVERLLRQGADIHAHDSDLRTALHHAARMAHLDIVKALVLSGSDVNATDKWGKTPMQLACEDAKNIKQPEWRDTEQFLLQQRGSVYGENTVLRPQATDLEYFWIDAICINQADDLEKASQVAQIGDIYQAAEHVIVWLGREFQDQHDNTDHVLHGSWRLQSAREGDRIPPETLGDLVEDPVAVLESSQTSKIRLAAVDWLNTQGQDRINEWMLGLPLFQRTWFNRAWILQEVFMAKDITVVCGPYLLPWDLFVFLSAIVEACRLVVFQRKFDHMLGMNRDLCSTGYARAAILSGNPRLNKIAAVSLHRHRRAFKQEGRLSMMPALILSRNQKCADARDKVFSVLAFASIQYPTEKGPRSFVPDYTRSTRELFLEVGRSLLAMYGPSALLLSGRNGQNWRENLPSWLPDLDSSSPVDPRGISTDLFNAREVQSPDIKYNHENGSLYTSTVCITTKNELLIQAYVWDTVSETAYPGLNDVGAELDGLKRWLELVSKLEIPSEERVQTLWRTLIEYTTAPTPDGQSAHRLSNKDFKGWLTFVCITAALGHHENFRTDFRSLDDYDRFHHEKSNRPEWLIESMINQTESYLEALGIPWSHDEARQRKSIDWYSSKDGNAHAICGLANYSAMPFGYFVGRNDPSRRMLRTQTHNVLGTGPEVVQPGDAICIVDGASVPYLVRPSLGGRYEFIGRAYLYVVDTNEMLEATRDKGDLKSLCLV